MHKPKINSMYHIHEFGQHESLDSRMLETSVEVKEIGREARSRNNKQVHGDDIVDHSEPCCVMYIGREQFLRWSQEQCLSNMGLSSFI